MTNQSHCKIGNGRAGRTQSGFSVVEMMVATTVSLFVIGALITVVLGGSSTSRARERATDLQVNGRYALDQIKRDLLHSGYLGVTSFFFPDQPISMDGINVTGACDGNIGRITLRIWGANDANPFAATCIPAANYSAGDVMLIRALEPDPVSAPFSANRVYYHSAYEGGQPFVGPTAPDFTGTNRNPPYLDFEMKETAYYVSPYTNAPGENPQVPALYRTRLDAGPAMLPELVATGVENFQIRYGVFQTNDTVRYLSAAEMAADDWDFVKSVQIWLLMRSPLPDPGYQNNTTYTVGEQNVVANDNFRRLLLTSVVELRN